MAASPERTSSRSRAYEFVCEIARGGMASVALVVRREGGFTRAYAEKRLLAAFGEDPDVRAMFMDEARIAGLLRHPNVVSVLDVGEDERGAYLLMDYVEGVPLTALIRRVAQRGDPTPLQVCLDVVIQAARGLHAAHTLTDHDGTALELVHRDVSPHNLLVGFDGIVRVTDFGIARALGRRTKTTTGILKGKTGYMAPEMLRFEPADRRADLFSLGVVLYELVAGKRLYRDRDQVDTARRILHEAPPDLGLVRVGVPDELVKLSFELLAKDPAHRPATAKDVARRLEAIRHDLAAVEGEHELDQYMRENLDETEVRDRRSLIQDLERGIGLPPVRAVATASAPAAEPEPGRSRGVANSAIAVVLVLVGVAVGLGAAFATGVLGGDRRDADAPSGAAPRASEPTAGAASALEREAARLAQPGAEQAASAAEPVAPTMTEPSAEPSVAEAGTPAMTAPSMRRRSRAEHRTRMAEGTAVPVIDEY